MNGIDELAQLKDGGFSDEELGQWTVDKHKQLSEAGFGQGEINTYFGEQPFDPKPITAHVNENIKRATAAPTEGAQPKPVTNFMEALEAGFQMSVTGLLAHGKPTLEVPEDASRAERIASQVGTLAGDVPAMVGGYMLGGANPITGTAGAFALPAGMRKILMDKYENGEVKDFSDFWDRASGALIDTAKGYLTGAATGAVGKAIGMAPILSPTAKAAATMGGEISTMVAVGSALEGQIPKADDFLDAALALGFIKASVHGAKKLRNIYAKTGVKPEDLAADAMKDPTIMQDLHAENMEIPKAYEQGKPTEKASVDDLHALADKTGMTNNTLRDLSQLTVGKRHLDDMTPKEREQMASALQEWEPDIAMGGGAPGRAAKAAAAQQARIESGSALAKIGEKISVGEERATTYNWNDLYKDMVDDLNPIGQAVKRSGLKLAAEDNPYTLARLSRGTFGKADHFLEQGTYDFKTLKNTGESLKTILEPLKDDLQGLREYAVAKRTVELAERGVESGVDLQTAKAGVTEGKAKYDAISRKLVEYQNELTRHLRDAGIISEENYVAMKEANKQYIPFFRVMDEQAAGIGKGFSVNNPIKKIKGSERQIIDPLESVIKNTYAYIAIAEKNAVGTKFLEMANKTGHPEDFAVKVKAPSKVVHLTEPEIKALFDEFMTVKQKTVSTKTSTSTTTEPDAKAFTLIKNRTLEALKARGFAEGEAAQMVARLEAKQSSGATVETLIKEVQKTELVPELDIRLPNDVATVFRSMQVPLKPNEIAIFENGKRSVYELEPDVAAAFKSADSETANLLVKMLAVPAKTLRAGAILSPDFMARNFARDQLSAFILSRGGYLPVFDFMRGAMSLWKQDAHFGNWLKSGGANAAMVSVDRRYLQENLFKLSQETGLASRAWNVAKAPLEILRVTSELIENSTRMGEFRRVAGKDTSKGGIQKAGFASREVTLDFARIGAKTRALNMITAFANAQIQGVDRVVREFKEHPISASAKTAASVTLPSVLLWFANHDDPRYKEIPQWQKDLFWIVPTKDTLYRIPKPFELGVVFGSVPERILDSFFADNPHAFKDMEDSLIQAFLPNLIPNAASPIIEQFSNRSLFTGHPLVSQSAEKLMPEYQYNDYTTETAKALGALIGTFPGMTERAITDESTIVGGLARSLSSPALLENYLRAWTGGLGMYALQLADKGLREAGVVPDPVLPASTLADIPMVKAFVVRYPSATAQSIQDFYSSFHRDKVLFDTFQQMAKDGNQAGMDRVLAYDETALAQLSDVKDTLTDHSQMVRMIYKDPEMTPSDKRQLIDTLYFRMIELAGAGNQMLSDLKETTHK